MLLISVESIAGDDDLQLLKDLSIYELLKVRVTVASKFVENPLDTGSVVSIITSDYWQARGARRLEDALSYMPGFVALPHFLGVKQYAVRGFTSTNGSGIQTLWDGVPINTFPVGTAQLDHADIQLNTLKSIEVIRGPGSALYGSEAFHAVVSLNAFESERDLQLFSLRVGSNGYYEGSYKNSATIFDDWRVNLAISTNYQSDQRFSYAYLNGGMLQRSKRDYRYGTSTASIKLTSNQADKLAYKFGVYYNNYGHKDFFLVGLVFLKTTRQT